jgi:hypothetical protein
MRHLFQAPLCLGATLYPFWFLNKRLVCVSACSRTFLKWVRVLGGSCLGRDNAPILQAWQHLPLLLKPVLIRKEWDYAKQIQGDTPLPEGQGLDLRSPDQSVVGEISCREWVWRSMESWSGQQGAVRGQRLATTISFQRRGCYGSNCTLHPGKKICGSPDS